MDWTTRWTKRWRRRLRALLHKAAVERELEEELAFHLELETEKYVRQGMSAEAARRSDGHRCGPADHPGAKYAELRARASSSLATH
jgi:hypothetical protein